MHFRCLKEMADKLIIKRKEQPSLKKLYESAKQMIITQRAKYKEIYHQKETKDFEHHYNKCKMLKKNYRQAIKNNRHYNGVREALKALETVKSLKSADDIDQIYSFIELL